MDLRSHGRVAEWSRRLATSRRRRRSGEPGEPDAPELYEFRLRRGLPRYPRIVVYSLFGRLPLANVVFRTPGVEVIVVTSERASTSSCVEATPGSKPRGPSVGTDLRDGDGGAAAPHSGAAWPRTLGVLTT